MAKKWGENSRVKCNLSLMKSLKAKRGEKWKTDEWGCQVKKVCAFTDKRPGV